MYSPVQLALKYLKYYFTASNGRGHGIHSPFVFEFVTQVLTDDRQFYAYHLLERKRNQLLANEQEITVEDLGAGSVSTKSRTRRVGHIARSALKPARFGRLMFRMVNYYRAKTVIELGTSLGVTTGYFAAADPLAQVYTLEGAPEVANLAEAGFRTLRYNNIKLIRGNFDDTLPVLLSQVDQVDLAFVDGNHRQQPTINYFNQLLTRTTPGSILIFDDIHWSREMEDAWAHIKQHSAVTLTIDLFFIGLVFFRTEQKEKQHFTIRF